MLNASRMASNIKRLRFELRKKRLIDEKSLWVLNEAANNVQIYPPDQWKLVISPEKPLEFVHAESDGRLKPDIFCFIETGNKDPWPISHLSLVLRVWCTKQDVSFRPDWDSKELEKEFDRNGSYRRVIFRCHYDCCNEGQYAPIFHLQFGGKPTEKEYFWFPHYLELPRFISPPMDLILACEFVVANFFPSTYVKLRQDSVWRSIIKESEVFLVGKYYETCKNYFNRLSENQTLLDHLSSFKYK
jgi:hypothetical protein